MIEQDNFLNFKQAQKVSWGVFAPLEAVTIMPAAKLVTFSNLNSSNTVLDIGCGTGVVAITAAQLGAAVNGIDLSPTLIKCAQNNAKIANVVVDFQEGDAEELPYDDNSFDVVLSQFGHMFAPRPQVATQEMLRVLKPGGTIAFSTWPSDLYVGRLFALVAKYSPPPIGISPPSLWGDSNFIREQLGNHVSGLTFDQDIMQFPALSLEHYQQSVEETLGPVLKLVQESKDDQTKLNHFRKELKRLALPYFKENHIRQHYLMSRAHKNI